VKRELTRIGVVLTVFVAIMVLFAATVPGFAATPTPVAISDLPVAATVTPGSYLEISQGATPWSYKASAEAIVDAVITPFAPGNPAIQYGSLGVTQGITATGNITASAFSGKLPAHAHAGVAGDGGTFDAANLTSGAATDGYVLTADGAGGAAWETLPPALAEWTWGTWTSTSWDGDAKSGADGIIDLSAEFGLPANIDAIAATLTLKDDVTNVYGLLCVDSTHLDNGISQQTQVANVYVKVAGIIPCDANGDIYWKQGAQIDYVKIDIYGYLK